MATIPEEQDLQALTRLIREFSDAREWEAFHKPKNLAMALAVEVAELMEPLQWLTPQEADALVEDPETVERLASEIADVAIYLLRLADVLGIDVGPAVVKKVQENEERFPVERLRGRARLPGDG